MATVIGIFENQYLNNKPLTVVRPGSQTRRFTHVSDTIKTCYYAWSKNKCNHYSISHKKSYSINTVAKMFKSKMRYIKSRPGERFASSLTKFSQNNEIIVSAFIWDVFPVAFIQLCGTPEDEPLYAS